MLKVATYQWGKSPVRWFAHLQNVPALFPQSIDKSSRGPNTVESQALSHSLFSYVAIFVKRVSGTSMLTPKPRLKLEGGAW